MKIILISYIVTIPEYFGFPAWTPFLNYNIATKMLNLPQERRAKRIWQRDFFRGQNLDLESQHLLKSTSNTLNYNAYIRSDLELLDVNFLKELFNENYLNQINSFILLHKQNATIITHFKHLFEKNKYLRFVMRSIGIKGKNDLPELYSYYVLKAIEKGIRLSETTNHNKR